MKFLIKMILDYQIKNKCIEEYKKSVYEYAYLILFEELINIIIAFLVGIIFDSVDLIACFLGSYIPLRQFAGGYHADSGINCGIVSTIIICVVCLLDKICLIKLIEQNKYLILIIAEISIIVLAPVDSDNKRLSIHDKRKYKKNTIILLLIQIGFAIWGKMNGKDSLICGITYSHILLSCMLIIGFKKYLYRKEEKTR